MRNVKEIVHAVKVDEPVTEEELSYCVLFLEYLCCLHMDNYDSYTNLDPKDVVGDVFKYPGIKHHIKERAIVH